MDLTPKQILAGEEAGVSITQLAAMAGVGEQRVRKTLNMYKRMEKERHGKQAAGERARAVLDMAAVKLRAKWEPEDVLEFIDLHRTEINRLLSGDPHE